MNLLDLFEGPSDNLRALIQAIQSGGDATLNLGGDPVTLDSHEARWMYGKYKAFLNAGRQEEFIRDLNDPVRFDAHMRQLRSLIDKQKNFRGSVPGQRQVQGDVPAGLSEELQTLVSSLNEQDITPKALGIRHVGLIDKTKMTPEPVIVDFGPGKKFRITAPQDKRWFLNTWEGYRRTGQGDRFLEMMGTYEGFERVLDMFAQDHRQMQQRQTQKPSHQQKRRDQYMAAYQPRHTQKKNFKEADEVTPKTKRFMQRMRVQYPQARSDSEALMYHITNTQEKTQKEIDDLEKQASSMEKDLRQDLTKQIDSLVKRRGVTGGSLAQVRATTDKQQEIINKILKIDQEQQRALDDLESTIKGTGATAGADTGDVYRAARPTATTPAVSTPGVAPREPRPQKVSSVTTPVSPKPAEPVSIDLTDTEPVDISTLSQLEPTPGSEPSNVVPFPGKRRRKKRQQTLPFDQGGGATDNVADIRDVLKVAEGLADEFMAMAKAKGMNPRLRGTPDEERARTDAMLKQRSADRANAPKPQGPDAEERAKLEARLKELEAKFDPDFEYSDDYSFWSRQNDLSKQIRSIKQRLAQGVAEGFGITVKRDANENIITYPKELDEKKDACYDKVKSRYKVWPSAYASGALVQCRKKGADNWGTGGKKK